VILGAALGGADAGGRGGELAGLAGDGAALAAVAAVGAGVIEASAVVAWAAGDVFAGGEAGTGRVEVDGALAWGVGVAPPQAARIVAPARPSALAVARRRVRRVRCEGV
jgi:hypothetical protein